MREAFDELWIIDLEGDNLGPRKTENVFNIRTPVAIAIGARYGPPQPETPARVRYARITGTREEKYIKLNEIRSFADMQWQECFDGWFEPFLPRGYGNYFEWPLLTDLWPWQGCGAKFERSWPIGESRELLNQRWRLLVEAPIAEKKRMFREDDDRQVERQYIALRPPRQRLPSIASLPATAPPLEIVRYGFRSFDRQFSIADNRIGGRLNPALWLSHSEQQIYMTSLLTGVVGFGPASTVTACIPDLHHFRGSFGGRDVVPLWRDANATQPNLTAGLLDVLRLVLRNINAEDFFAYCYAVLATPAYVETFSEELKVPGPRIPVTKNRTLFQQAMRLGRRLIWLHTYGERFVPASNRTGEGPQGRTRCRRSVANQPEQYPEEFSYDETTHLLRVGDGEFSPVPKSVWDFSVSGLRIVHSWLSYRMKEGAGRSSSPLDEIRPERWTAQMSQELLELLWVLEATVEILPELKETIEGIVAGQTFRAEELPQPTAAQRQPPAERREEPQVEMTMGYPE